VAKPDNQQHTQISARQTQVTAPKAGAEAPLTSVATELHLFMGPLPPAEELARYEQIIPGSAERFLSLHERQFELTQSQSVHRQGLERCVIFNDNRRAYLGMVFAALFVAGGLFGSVWLGMHGHEVLGGTITIADTGTIAGLFIYGSQARKVERQQRSDLLLKEQAQATELKQIAEKPS
jgi:uncharacterized membrane protein